MKTWAGCLSPLLILLFCCTPPLVQSLDTEEGNNTIYKTLMTNYIAMSWADFAITYYNLDCKREELNPIARLYIDKPALSVAFIALDNLIIGYITRKIYNKNKLAGIALIGLVTIAKGYILYKNVELLRR